MANRSAPAGLILGHEITGEIIEKGRAVNRQLMQAILHGKIKIAQAVNVTVLPSEEGPKGYVDFDKGAAKKFVLDPHQLLAA